MPVERVLYYFVYCDQCNAAFNDNEALQDKLDETAEDQVIAAGWKVEPELDVESTTVTCPKCQKGRLGYLVIDRTANAAAALTYAAFIRSAQLPAVPISHDSQCYVVWNTRTRSPALECRNVQPVRGTALGKPS